MACVPGFDYDLFVSYAHIDDAPDVGQSIGWVTTLKDNLKTRIDRRLGIRSNIWMDQRLVAESQLSAPIMDGLRRSAGLLVRYNRIEEGARLTDELAFELHIQTIAKNTNAWQYRPTLPECGTSKTSQFRRFRGLARRLQNTGQDHAHPLGGPL